VIPRIAPPPQISRDQPGNGAQELGDPLKLFDFDPRHYEQQSRYEPIRKLQSSHKTQLVSGEPTGEILVFGDQQDDTVGSILDAISTDDIRDDDFFSPSSTVTEKSILNDDVTKRDTKRSSQSPASVSISVSHI